MDELRWILLGVGLVVIAAVYFFGDPSRRAAAREIEARRRGPDGGGEAMDETMERELARLGEMINEDRGGEVPSPAAAGPGGAVNAEPERVVVLYLKPPRGLYFKGPAILRATEKAGLVFGELDIFHRLSETTDQPTAIFSLANIAKPGNFRLDAMEQFSSPGLCLFMTLPNVLPALDAWDAMLATGRRLADLLDADLQDESHSSLIRQRIAQIREEMRAFDRARELDS